MQNYHLINMQQWVRKEHFDHFSQLDNPLFSVSIELDITKLYQLSKKYHFSFYLSYLHTVTAAINQVDNFRLRIIDKQVRLYQLTHPGTVIFHSQTETISFLNFNFVEDFSEFYAVAKPRIEQAKQQPQTKLNLGAYDLIHYSAIPWFKINGFTHARNFDDNQGIPRIIFSQLFKNQNRYWLPTSIEVHHGLMDAYHIGKFIESFNYLVEKFEVP